MHGKCYQFWAKLLDCGALLYPELSAYCVIACLPLHRARFLHDYVNCVCVCVPHLSFGQFRRCHTPPQLVNYRANQMRCLPYRT